MCSRVSTAPSLGPRQCSKGRPRTRRLLSALMTKALLALSLAHRFKRGFALRRKLILVRIEAGPDPAVTTGFRRAKLSMSALQAASRWPFSARRRRAQRCGDEKRRRGNLECCLHHGLLNRSTGGADDVCITGARKRQTGRDRPLALSTRPLILRRFLMAFMVKALHTPMRAFASAVVATPS